MGDPPNRRGKKPCITEGSGIYKPRVWDPMILRVNTISELTSSLCFPHLMLPDFRWWWWRDPWVNVRNIRIRSFGAKSIAIKSLANGTVKGPSFLTKFQFFKKASVFVLQKSWLVSPALYGPPGPQHQKWPGSLMMRALWKPWGFPIFLRGLR